MRWPSACPRCQGDLVLDSGGYGPFVSCARCGSVLSGPQERVLLGLVRPASGRRGRGEAELQSLDSLVRCHERLAEAEWLWPGDTASVPGNAAARGCLR